jgi:D-alanyl-D-alanine carboxypeptidase
VLRLFAQGATQLKTIGVHHYGLACDLVRDNSGTPSWKGDFKFLGKLAKKYDLVWGGDWGKPQVKTRFLDDVHVQRCAVSDQKSNLLVLGTRTRTTILTTKTSIRIVLERMWLARPKAKAAKPSVSRARRALTVEFAADGLRHLRKH